MYGRGYEGSLGAEEQNARIAQSLPLVRRLAYRLAKRLPAHIDVDDLIGAGHEGLMQAVRAYTPAPDVSFEAYAATRIRGAMLDVLRREDPLTRQGRQRMNEVTRQIGVLEAELQRPPTEEEVAAALGLSLDDYYVLMEELSRGPALAHGTGLDPDAFGEVDPTLDRLTLARLLSQAIGALPPRLQMVLALYYQEDLTQAEIAAVLEVTEGRVCQLLGEALVRMRARLGVETRKSPKKTTSRKGDSLHV